VIQSIVVNLRSALPNGKLSKLTGRIELNDSSKTTIKLLNSTSRHDPVRGEVQGLGPCGYCHLRTEHLWEGVEYSEKENEILRVKYLPSLQLSMCKGFFRPGVLPNGIPIDVGPERSTLYFSSTRMSPKVDVEAFLALPLL
jgi:hypothetical protein